MTLLHAMDGLSQVAGLLSAFGFFPYSVRELLSCWLLFAAFFVSVALIIFASVLAFHTGKYLIQWTRTASRVAGKVDVALPARLR